jgi:hypothetical protein
VWRHRSVSLNNEKNCCEISEDKIAFCEKTAGLRRGKFSDSNSACLKVLVPVKIFQFQDMLNESERYQDAANGLTQCPELSLIKAFPTTISTKRIKLGRTATEFVRTGRSHGTIEQSLRQTYS